MSEELWEKCIALHGHSCGGLRVGYQAALYAMELLKITRAEDEEVVCISENDACGVDAIQALLGCTVGKGNLIFNICGKQAFTFFERKGGKSVRLVLRATPEKNKDERLAWLMEGDYHEMFDVKTAAAAIPEPARIFRSQPCSICGEQTAENHLRVQDGVLVCEACFSDYTRGL